MDARREPGNTRSRRGTKHLGLEPSAAWLPQRLVKGLPGDVAGPNRKPDALRRGPLRPGAGPPGVARRRPALAGSQPSQVFPGDESAAKELSRPLHARPSQAHPDQFFPRPLEPAPVDELSQRTCRGFRRRPTRPTGHASIACAFSTRRPGVRRSKRGCHRDPPAGTSQARRPRRAQSRGRRQAN
jgi:hypothetical protein